jgi:osmoprotectant transport system ATP-binding protein
MGDRIAVLREGGVLEQFGTPAELLAAPASDFVARFLGADAALKQLSIIPVATAAGMLSLEQAAAHGAVLFVDAAGRPVQWADGTAACTVAASASLRTAHSSMLGAGAVLAAVVDDEGRPVGVLPAAAIQHALLAQHPAAQVFDTMHGRAAQHAPPVAAPLLAPRAVSPTARTAG